MSDMKRINILLIATCLVASQAFAVSVPDAATMLKNLSTQVPTLIRLVTATSFVMGFFFVYKGLVEFKKFGEQRSMMSGEHHIAGPLIYLFVGTMLIYLPETVRVGLNTLWNSPNVYAYETTATDAWSSLTNAVYLVIELVGVISFIRGLVLLSHLGGQHGGGQQGTFGRALAHIIAGVLCINLYGFVQVISNTLGIQWD